MAINGKQKGKRGERELAKIFSDWWGVPDSFARTPDSGAFSTRRRTKGQKEETLRGDVFGPEKCQFHIEAKFREQWSLDAFFEGTIRPLEEWWRQATYECGDKLPILVFRKKRFSWLVATRVTSSIFKKIRFVNPSMFIPIQSAAGAEVLIVVPLTCFLGAIKPEDVCVDTSGNTKKTFTKHSAQSAV